MTEPSAGRFSVLVRFMQVLGLFPYIWPTSQPTSRPRFSLPLSLWVVFLQLISLGILCSETEHYILISPKIHDFGALSLFWANIYGILLPVLLGFLMVLQGRHLADLLPRLEESAGEAAVLGMSSHFTLKVKAISLLFGFLAVFGGVAVGVYPASTTNVFMVPFVMVQKAAVYMVVLLHLFFFTGILIFLGNYVNHLVRTALPSPLTTELQAWSTLTQAQDEGPWEQQMSQLLHLEHRIRKVHKMKALILDYFGWTQVLVLLCGLIQLITGLYNILLNPTFYRLMITLGTAIFPQMYSRIGEVFKNKILASADLLRDHSAISPHLPLKAQVQRLCEQLEALAPVTLGGMVTLGHGNFPAMLSLLATYLLVLMQVGNQQFMTSLPDYPLNMTLSI